PTAVNPTYGTLRDFQTFLREAHRRGLRVITEIILNHTSDQHPWFQRARRAQPGSRHRNFYVWSDTPEKYQDARIIFRDFEASNWSWDPVAKAYFWHRFYAHQPDLNYDSPDVRRAMLQVVDFWLNMGVDGLRLDAVPYLYEREGTSCENLEETHAFLKTLRQHVDRKYKNRMLLAEANQWPSDAVAYFGEGDECHMAFHFPLMPRMFMALRVESRYPIIEILQQTPPIPDNSQWALFLRNHDELTLEMVTDEERDYMYRIYANDPQARINLGIRRRLGPLLGNNRRRIELMNGLLFSLPGAQVLYYGDEIGMGDNIYLGDRNGVRPPMQWSGDRNAGFSRANPQKLYLPVIIDPEYHYETVNVEAEQSNPSSLLWWTKRLIALRKRYQAFSRGSIEFLYPENHKVLAFLRRYEDQQVLVVANLSRFVQGVELDLSAYRGMVPVELFGRTKFPPVGDLPYFLTLGPHSFYWFALEPQAVPLEAPAAPPSLENLPALVVAGAWETVFQGRSKAALEEMLPEYLRTRPWFDGKPRTIQAARILDAGAVPNAAPAAFVTVVEVRYTEGDPDMYALPLAFADGEEATHEREAGMVLARLRAASRTGPVDGVLYDAFYDRAFAALLPDAMARRRRFRGGAGEIYASATRAMGAPLAPEDAGAILSTMKGEPSNSTMVFGDRFMLKLYRRLHRGQNPDLEVGRFLTERTAFEHVPPVAGALEYRPREGEPITLGMLQRYVPNEGTAWDYTLDALSDYYERVLALPGGAAPATSHRPLLELAAEAAPAEAVDLIGCWASARRNCTWRWPLARRMPISRPIRCPTCTGGGCTMP
ncbi:MAG: maltose alpha-D-glucosyltransferase, partial [Chloroflexi bacterium]|nr:maltose alpha-D-glucosyltransferase [Chloroflexota bacterium]